MDGGGRKWPHPGQLKVVTGSRLWRGSPKGAFLPGRGPLHTSGHTPGSTPLLLWKEHQKGQPARPAA